MAEQKPKTQDWANIIKLVKTYVVKIMTPDGFGTGFLVTHTKSKKLVGIATAFHVIEQAYLWKQPIRIRHEKSGKEVFLTDADRAIYAYSDSDTAAIVFPKGDIPFPADALPLTDEGYYLRIGKEVGWLGYPVMASTNLCFFSGRLSCWESDQKFYFVDGVAINGVSGGPVFYEYRDGQTRYIGFVSAYLPNRATGSTLPGLCIVRSVASLYDTIKSLNSLEDAKEEAPPPPDPKQNEPSSSTPKAP